MCLVLAEKTNKKASYGKKLISSLAVTVFTVFTLLFFSPMEIYLGNVIEFKFSTDVATIILLITSTILSVVVSLLVSLLPTKILRFYNIFVFGAGLASYIQALFLNGNMISLNGDEYTYGKKLLLGNILIWVSIFAVLLVVFFIMKKYKKAKTYFSTMRFLALALIVMQIAGFASAYLKVDKSVNSVKNTYISSSGNLEISENENVVCFIVDSCDGSLVTEALNKYPDMFEGYDGFTYFPNMITTHSRTYPSLPYLLTGEICYFDKPYTEYVNQAFENSSFIDDIKALNTDIRLYTDPQYIGQSALDKIDNIVRYDSSHIGAVNIPGFIKQTIKVSGYRVAPYIAKDIFKYTSQIINNNSLKPVPERYIAYDDIGFNERIQENGVVVNTQYNKSLRLYHMHGPHGGSHMDENCNHKIGVAMHDNVRGCLRLIEGYINEMKENGTFEKSTIIITADHGFSLASDDLNLRAAPTCIMMVKPAGVSDAEEMKTSLAPVSHTDFFATVISGLGGDGSKYGRTFMEIGENEVRERKYYHTALVSDIDGEIALREYAVNGDARLLENYKQTGNNWDVNYSERAISKKRLKDFINK